MCGGVACAGAGEAAILAILHVHHVQVRILFVQLLVLYKKCLKYGPLMVLAHVKVASLQAVSVVTIIVCWCTR